MKTLYIAYPIDRAGRDVKIKHIRSAVYHLKARTGLDLAVFDPGLAWSVTNDRAVGPELQEVNRAALMRADSVLAFLPAGVPTFGVPAEITQAVDLGLNVAIVSDQPASWAVPTPNERVAYFQTEKPVQSGPVDGEEWFRGASRALLWLSNRTTGTQSGELLERARESLFCKEVPDAREYPLPGKPTLPTRAYADDAGLDLYVSHDVGVAPGQFLDVPTNLAVELPDWSWGFLVGRSSTLRKRHLMVNPGIIDCGYRGELYAGVWNLGSERVNLKRGERIAQLIIMENATRKVVPTEVALLGEHARGSKGFGSSGN